ncbi:hypothetical protein NLI96_g11550 [Meripilus lineatus]|uniref:Uncharacterized protein n=1 Tax=Meripilus lineatus TaxID=2056292 RepID=A0AAD5UT10_9APHY|nr:hypothetical protein NLI96_g11550 [Physisporinus lineatus]
MEDSRLTYQEEQLRRGSTSDETKVAGPTGQDSKSKAKAKEKEEKKFPPLKRKLASSFIREPSQMPDGGYLRKATKKRYESSNDEDSDSPPWEPPTPPSSSSSELSPSSSSESPESSDSELSSLSSSKTMERPRERQETNRGIKQPFIWKGLPDLEISDQWVYEHVSHRKRAQEVKEKEEQEFRGKCPGRGWEWFKNRTIGLESVKQAEQTPAKPETNPKALNLSKKHENSAKNGQENSQKGKGKDIPHEQKNPLTREERDCLRAEGRCFNYKDVGYKSRNCPKRKTAKASTVHAGSVRFDKLEQLAKQARYILNVSAIRIDSDEMLTDLEDSENEQEYLSTGKDNKLRELIRAIILSTHQIETEDLEERFQVIDLGNRFEVVDWEDRPSESCIIYKE